MSLEKGNPLLLLVEDDLDLLAFNTRMLLRHGYAVRQADTIAQARAFLSSDPIELIVLDILLPDGTGLDFIQEIRAHTTAPVLLLSSLRESHEIVEGLKAGGDDYMTKPFRVHELLARIEGLLRRQAMTEKHLRETIARENQAQRVTLGPLSLDGFSMRATLGGVDLQLTPREFSLLLALAHNVGKPLSIQALYASAWAMDAVDVDQAVRVQISRLRTKLSPYSLSGIHIISVRGLGYQLVLSGA